MDHGSGLSSPQIWQRSQVESTTRLSFCSVWVFYNDNEPLLMKDCFYNCVMQDGLSTSDNQRFRTTAVSKIANDTGVSHREGPATVRRFTVGNTGHFLLVFTGKATLNLSISRNTTRIVWMLVLITRESTTDACTCGSCLCIGGLSVPTGSYQVVELLHWFASVRNLPLHVTIGVHGAGTIDRSDSFLTLLAGRAKFVGK